MAAFSRNASQIPLSLDRPTPSLPPKQSSGKTVSTSLLALQRSTRYNIKTFSTSPKTAESDNGSKDETSPEAGKRDRPELASVERQQISESVPVGKSRYMKNALERAAVYKRMKSSSDKRKFQTDASGNFTTGAANYSRLQLKETMSTANFESTKNEDITRDDTQPPPKAPVVEDDQVSSLLTEEKGTGTKTPASRDVEVEIITRDGVITRKVSRPEETFSKIKEPKRLGVSTTDFTGLDFSEENQCGPPAVGLGNPSPANLPEVEIITQDVAKAEKKTSESGNEDLYRPKVATWGVFPRPVDISKTFGGGRTIRPGEQLETEEEKRVREARTQQLLAEYKKKVGLNVDPAVKAECEQVLKQGDGLVDNGKLQDALACFEKVMQQMPFESTLHGLAALQFSLCLDSMSRYEEACCMYEKICSHPDSTVRKKAKQLLFGFQAMQKLKLSTSNEWDASTYQKYFDAFADGYNTTYKARKEELPEDWLTFSTLIYAMFLFFPIVLVFILAALRNR